MVSCWEKTDLLVLLYVRFSCGFVIFPYGDLCQVWYLIVCTPDLCFFLTLMVIVIYKHVKRKYDWNLILLVIVRMNGYIRAY